VFNVVWLIFWQTFQLAISVVVIVLFLATLIAIYLRLGIGKANVSMKEKLFVHVPFSVYLGWVTIATIANIAVTLVSVGWDGFGLSLQTWAILVLAIAVLLNLIVIATRRDIAYSLVFIWALAGIAVNQTQNATVVSARGRYCDHSYCFVVAVVVSRLCEDSSDQWWSCLRSRFISRNKQKMVSSIFSLFSLFYMLKRDILIVPNFSKKPVLTVCDEEYFMLIEVSEEFEKQRIA
jgi:hypothetical protein